MALSRYVEQTKAYVLRRCREHLKWMALELGRPLTFDYRFEHTRTAVAFATGLAPELNVSASLGTIAAWLHDIAKCWDPALTKTVNLDRREHHGVIGGQEAEEFLRGLDFPRAAASQVREAIAAHVGYQKDYTITEPLNALLWDADKLSKIGVAGTMHFLCKQLSYGRDLIDLEEHFSAEIIPLHLAIRDSLNTPAARRWADEELAAAAAFRRQVLAGLRSVGGSG